MTSNDDKLAGSTDSAEPLKKKSLSKYGPFNQSAIASRGNDSDEEYGVLVREEGSEEVKQTKKSLSKYGSHSVERIVVVKEEEEEYGSFDPNFKLEKVAHTSKGELVVIPENPTPKTIKKTLSKYGTPSSVQKTPVSVRSADSDDEDYGNLEPNNAEQKKIKKSLSKYSPKNSVNNFEGKLSFENIKIDSDEEYGELDPNFKPVPVAVTSSGHYVVPPEADPNKKVMKKTLSKYNVSTVVKSPPKVVKIGEDSDEEYGTLEKEAENNTPASGKKIKKTLSKYKDVNVTTSPAVASVAAADILKSNDSDEEYGKDIDTSYLDSARATSRKSLTQSLSPINSVSKSRSDDTTTSNGEVVVESLAPVKALVAKIEKNKVNN